MKPGTRIVIIGGGLSGLTLAYLLRKENIGTILLEASGRLGGRIQTIKGELETPLELGATWFSDLHVNLLQLINELGLTRYPQFSGGISLFQTKSFEPPQQFFVPEADQPSYRLAGGTQRLTDTLAQKLDPGYVHLNARVSMIRQTADGLTVTITNGDSFKADRVILCLPPQLAATIGFEPALPTSLAQLLPTVQTWMAGAVKFVLEYREPFWRNKSYSGMLYSHAGIITEMYDHTNFENNKYALTGFLGGGAAGYSQEVRKELVLQQLSELFGEEVLQPLTYQDKIWTDEFVSAGNPLIHRPHQNNGHPAFQVPHLAGKLYFCGTETGGAFPGYMEGAVHSAKSIACQLLA